MINGKAERIIEKIKHEDKRPFLKSEQLWPDLVAQVIYGFGCRAVRNKPSPFLLMYGDQPRVCSADAYPILDFPIQ